MYEIARSSLSDDRHERVAHYAANTPRLISIAPLIGSFYRRLLFRREYLREPEEATGSLGPGSRVAEKDERQLNTCLVMSMRTKSLATTTSITGTIECSVVSVQPDAGRRATNTRIMPQICTCRLATRRSRAGMVYNSKLGMHLYSSQCTELVYFKYSQP